MNKTEKWIIGALATLMLAALGYLIGQIDALKSQIGDMRVELATVSTKLDAHMAEKHAQVYQPKDQARNSTEAKP